MWGGAFMIRMMCGVRLIGRVSCQMMFLVMG